MYEADGQQEPEGSSVSGDEADMPTGMVQLLGQLEVVIVREALS